MNPWWRIFIPPWGHWSAPWRPKDSYTRRHSLRVTNLSVLTAQHIGLDLGQIESLRFAAYLHDIGKIGIKDMVLLKPDKLTDEEYQHIKQHPVIGESITLAMDLTSAERAIIRHHHESWDGSGYPDGLAGTAIPMLARVVAVADAFDAMTTDRPYRKAKTRSEAVDELTLWSGKQFDPDLVRAFVETLNRYHSIEELDQDAAAQNIDIPFGFARVEAFRYEPDPNRRARFLPGQGGADGSPGSRHHDRPPGHGPGQRVVAEPDQTGPKGPPPFWKTWPCQMRSNRYWR